MLGMLWWWWLAVFLCCCLLAINEIEKDVSLSSRASSWKAHCLRLFFKFLTPPPVVRWRWMCFLKIKNPIVMLRLPSASWFLIYACLLYIACIYSMWINVKKLCFQKSRMTDFCAKKARKSTNYSTIRLARLLNLFISSHTVHYDIQWGLNTDGNFQASRLTLFCNIQEKSFQEKRKEITTPLSLSALSDGMHSPSIMQTISRSEKCMPF